MRLLILDSFDLMFRNQQRDGIYGIHVTALRSQFYNERRSMISPFCDVFTTCDIVKEMN